MLTLAYAVLAQGAQNTQEAPSSGVGAALIIGTLVAIVVVLGLVFLVVTRRAKASRGGAQAAPGSRERGEPPFESIERDR
jgi:hypothetical protein